MRFTKILAASIVSTALAASMVISASATTYMDVANAATAAGVPSQNVQQLKNFFEPNASKFTSAAYDEFISEINRIRDTYVAPKASSMFGKSPAELTEDEKVAIGRAWTEDERKAITDAVVALGNKYGVTVSISELTSGGYNVSATLNGSGGTQVGGGNGVANTGLDMSEEPADSAVAFAGLALVLAATGVVIVTRKNRA